MPDNTNTPKSAMLVLNIATPRVRGMIGKLVLAQFAKDTAATSLYVALKGLSDSDRATFQQNIAAWSDGSTLLTADAHIEDVSKLKTHIENTGKSRKVKLAAYPITSSDDRAFGVKVVNHGALVAPRPVPNN